VLHAIGSADAWNVERGPSVGHAGMMWVDECPAQNIHPILLGTVPYVAMNMPVPTSTMGNPFQALQNMMAPCLVTPQTQSVAAPSSQRPAAVRIVNKKMDNESAFRPSAPMVSQQAVTSQTQASGESAGQMLLRMVQGPKTHDLHGTDRSRWADASESGSDCSTADTMDTVLAAINGAPVVPQLGSPELPTAGSKGHSLGTCKPCAFNHKEGGCQSGIDCEFCHLCGPNAKKQRKKDKVALRRLAREGQMHSSRCAACIVYQ